MSNEASKTEKLVVPGFRGSPSMELELAKTRAGESRFLEAKDVNPITYADLEHSFNESYRELKRHHATVGFQLTLADKTLKQAKAEFIIDKYPAIMEGKPKTYDTAERREAHLMRDKEYLEALDRVNQLKALEAFIDGKIKVLENVCRYMRKRMDLIMRSGLSDGALYITSGKKNG